MGGLDSELLSWWPIFLGAVPLIAVASIIAYHQLNNALVISRDDLARISRNLEYFSDDLARRITEAERRRTRTIRHPVIGLIDVDTGRSMVSKTRESAEKLDRLAEIMIEAGIEEIKLE